LRIRISYIRILIRIQHFDNLWIRIQIQESQQYTGTDPTGPGSRSECRFFCDIKKVNWFFWKTFLFFFTYFFCQGRNSFKWDENISYKLQKNIQIKSLLKLLDPYPDPYIIYGSGSRRANYIRIQLDPDPQHCF